MHECVKYIDEYLERNYPELSIEDLDNVLQAIDVTASAFDMSKQDALAYALCFEEINPDLGEEEAIQRMDRIIDKYKRPS